jgi:hypothetical protein
VHAEIDLSNLPHDSFPTRIYHPELDDVRSILMDVCDWLQPHARFAVSGFGQAQWPVDGRTDLCVLLEQLPRALLALASDAPFEIDFYEQGPQRKVTFEPSGNNYMATCLSYGDWNPNPSVETLDRAALETMLVTIQTRFMQAFRAGAPDLVDHPWVQSWFRGEAQL